MALPEEPALRLQFARTQRSAWMDFHIALQLLVPAGMSGDPGADMWLILVGVVMFLRFLWANQNRYHPKRPNRSLTRMRDFPRCSHHCDALARAVTLAPQR